MASWVVRIDDLQQCVNGWITAVSAYCGQPTITGVGWGGLVRVQWPQCYVPPGEDPNWVLFRQRHVERLPPVFEYADGLFASLSTVAYQRIKWFYYCDNALGNSINLYDAEHFNDPSNQGLYIELIGSGRWLGVNQDFPMRVIFRGINLETETRQLKRHDLRATFQDIVSAGSAPLPRPPTAGAAADPLQRLLAHTPPDPVDVEGMCEQFFEKRHAYFQYQTRNNMPANALTVQCAPACSRPPCTRRGSVP
jgi:hypothetical protein